VTATTNCSLSTDSYSVDRRVEKAVDDSEKISTREYFEKFAEKATLASIVLGATYAASKLPKAYAHSGDVIEVPPALIIPEIDGQYTTPVENLGRSILGKEKEEEGWVYKNEWEDARLISFYPGFNWVHGISNLRIKHDEEWLYGIVDFISDEEINNTDWCHVSIDIKNDGGNLPQTDDYLFAGEWDTRGSPKLSCYMRQGAGKETEFDGWSDTLKMKDAFMASSKNTSPDSDVEHLIYEFKISKKYFSNSVAGMSLSVLDSSPGMPFMVWPSNEPRILWSHPSAWGDIKFLPMENNYAIPESSHVAGLATAATVAAAVAAYEMKRRRYLKSLPGLVLTGCL